MSSPETGLAQYDKRYWLFLDWCKMHKAGQSVLEGHLRHCVRDAINEGHGEDALEHLSKAIEQFIKI